MAVNLPDDKKGEQIVLLVAAPIDADALRKGFIENQTNPLMIPAKIFSVEAIPKLGSGKTDFSGAKHLALSLV